MTRRTLVAFGCAALTLAASAHAEPPNGPGYLRLLGPRAQAVLEPRGTSIGALVRLPLGVVAGAVGLEPFTTGFARLRGSGPELLAFASAHPELALEVAPPPHFLLDQVGRWTHATTAHAAGATGKGVLVGIADTGIDFSLADFRDPAGKLRVAWLLDLAYGAPSTHLHDALEAKYGGVVYDATDLENLLGNGALGPLVTDTTGHGTHVASIAAGNGGPAKKYVGLAPEAQLIVARVTRGADESITTDDVLSGIAFLFDRADAMNKPIAANLSLGSDFGPHDGTMAWEESLATFVGPEHPGRALTIAAGNSGNITAMAVHATVYVPPGDLRRVPISVARAGSLDGQAQVQVWVTMRGDADLAVGLDAPEGTWIAPVPSDQTGGLTVDGGAGYQAGVFNGSSVSMSMIPSDSHSAIVIWAGTIAAGTYAITLTGHGVADLYVEGAGDLLDIDENGVGFVDPVREGTINLPATNPGLIGVGCTVNRGQWTSIDDGPVTVPIALLDGPGGYALDSGAYATPRTGDICWFSSAGPTVTGVPKPEISAPGGIVVGALSAWALPGSPDSIFTNDNCPALTDGGASDPRCMQVDATHAVAVGTSMSAPQAAGAAALLFQRDPTLTQDQIVGLLQAGAHPFRTGTPRFEDQGGPGELDVQGSLDALEQTKNPALVLPSLAASWITLSADELTADGSTPLTAILELRTAGGTHRADLFNASRLRPVVKLDGSELSQPPPLARRAPGVWVFTVTPPAGLGGHTLTLGATFDGEAIVSPKTVAIATDAWTAAYPGKAGGGCAISARRDGHEQAGVVGWGTVLALMLGRHRRRRHSVASATTQPCGSQR